MFPFNRKPNWGQHRLSKLPQATQPGKNRAGIEIECYLIHIISLIPLDLQQTLGCLTLANVDTQFQMTNNNEDVNLGGFFFKWYTEHLKNILLWDNRKPDEIPGTFSILCTNQSASVEARGNRAKTVAS